MYIYKIPQKDIVRIHVTGDRTRKTVAEVAADFHSKISSDNHSLVVNGDGFRGNQSQSIWVSEGMWKNNTQKAWRPRLIASWDSQLTLSFRSKPYYYPIFHPDFNTFSLTRRLIIAGKINPRFKDNHELNARIGFGLTANGELIIAASDGWDLHHEGKSTEGWTLTQLAENLIDQGVVEGGDGDGGGSMTIAVDGQVINNWYNDNAPMRKVLNHFCLELSVLENISP